MNFIKSRKSIKNYCFVIVFQSLFNLALILAQKHIQLLILWYFSQVIWCHKRPPRHQSAQFWHCNIKNSFHMKICYNFNQCAIVVWENSKTLESWNIFDMIVHCVYKLGVGGLNKILGSWLRQIFYTFTFLPHLVNNINVRYS